jgi:RNA polymerase sigma-70 factor (sigma-E family)
VRTDANRAMTDRAESRRARFAQLEDLYARHIGATVRLAYLLTGDREAAQDIAQDAFIRSFGRWKHLRDASSFPSYVRATAVNLSRSHHRRRSVEQRYIERDGARPSAIAQEPGASLDGELRSALLSLPQRQRAAVVLRFYEDLSEAQTAEVLGCSVGNVKALTSKGMAKLREVFRDD